MSSKRGSTREVANPSPDTRRQLRALEALPEELQERAQRRLKDRGDTAMKVLMFYFNVGRDIVYIRSNPERKKYGEPDVVNYLAYLDVDDSAGSQAAKLAEWKTETELRTAGLTWNHYREMLTGIKDQMVLEKVFEKVTERPMSVREVRAEVAKRKPKGRAAAGGAARPVKPEGMMTNVQALSAELRTRFGEFERMVFEPLADSPPDARVVAKVRQTREALELTRTEIDSQIESLRKIEQSQVEKAKRAAEAANDVIKADARTDADPHPAGDSNGVLKNRLEDHPAGGRRARPATT